MFCGKLDHAGLTPRAVCRAKLKELADRECASGQKQLDLDTTDRAEVFQVLAEIAAAGHTVRQVWDAFRTHSLKPVSKVSLGDAIKRLLDAKRASNRREIYLDSLEQFLARFSKSAGIHRPLSDITSKEIQDWLAKYGKNLSSRATWLNRISTLFQYAIRRRWIQANPCDEIERVTIDHKTPATVSPRVARLLLRLVRRKMPDTLPYLVLGLFCGVRPHELTRLTWGVIDLKRKTITLDATRTKTRSRRIVPIADNAVQWLALVASEEADKPIAPSPVTLRRRMRRIRDRFGLSRVPADILRHTAASNLLAREQDIGRVATWLGNSPGILAKHYLALVTKESAADFWSITPANVKPTILELPTQAAA